MSKYNNHKNVLVTGGMGFIGKVLCKKIINQTNYKLTIIDNLSSSNLDKEIFKNKRVQFIKKNFENWLPSKNQKFNQIYHLTSPVGPLGVLKHKGRIAELILKQLYKAAYLSIEMNSKLLEISTSEVYGKHPENENKGQKENIDKIVPSEITVRLEYGLAKLLCEIVLKNLSRENKLNYNCIRPFNITGPNQNGELGFVIPRFVEQCYNNRSITIYNDGKQKRTFTHVNDFVEAIFMIMESNCKGEIFNVGNPNNTIDILSLAKKIKLITKSKSKIVFIKPEKIFKDFAEAWNKIPNIEKIKKKINWEPKLSLDDILEEILILKKKYFLSYKKNM
jgi:nucleoside-diphosphate-sugar epimerase